MNQESYIAGCPTMITETLYKPQEDYAFVNKVKANEFMYNPNFKREPVGPFISDYYQHYEADQPQPNSLYSPVRIAKEYVNRQCNPFVAYPFGVPHKYESIKCPKCNGNATYGKKKKTKKEKHSQETDMFTSSLKKENQDSMACWSNTKLCIDTNPFTSCAMNHHTYKNFETASFKSNDPLYTHNQEANSKHSIQQEEEEESNHNSEKHRTHTYEESETSNHHLDKPSSYQAEECVMPSESYSKCSHHYIAEIDKSATNHRNFSPNPSKLYTLPHLVSEGMITSNEFGSSGFPENSMKDKTSPRGRGKLYLKLNNTSINEYSNILSSEGISEIYTTDLNSEQVMKSDDTNHRERKKVKISVNRKNERGKKEESMSQIESNQMIPDNIYTPKMKSLKLKGNQTDIEKKISKLKTPTTTLSDQAQVSEQETKRTKESLKKYKNKKSTPIRKISVSPSSVRKTPGETYSRMCKMQLAIDNQLKTNHTHPNSNKGLLTSEEDLFGSTSSRNIYSKSRVIYREEKKKEPKRKGSKDKNTLETQNISVSPRVSSTQNVSLVSDLSSCLSPSSNINQSNNISPRKDVATTSNESGESNTNQNEIPTTNKKKPTPTNKILVKGPSKEISSTKSKKDNVFASPRKTQFLKRNSKIGAKSMYQNKLSLAKKLSSKSNNVSTDRKNMEKNSLISEGNRETIAPKKTTKKSVSGTVKTSSISVNKTLTNNSPTEPAKVKHGFLKRKSPILPLKNSQDNKKNGTNINKIGGSEVRTKSVTTIPLKKTKTVVEENNKLGSKNLVSQNKENVNKKKINSVSDSALANESEEFIPRMAVKFGRSETKLYMPNHKIVPFKKTEVKMITKKDSGKMKIKLSGRINKSDTTTQRKVKEFAKSKKASTMQNQTSFLNKNIKGTLKNKKKELFDNIMLLTETMSKKNDIKQKTTKSIENKNREQGSESDSVNVNIKLKRVQTIKDKKRELIKREKKESTTARNMKIKDKNVEKKEKGEVQE